MITRVNWTTPALRQLEDIQDYIAQHDPRAAYALAQRIHTHVNEQLPEFPQSGREGRVPETRELIIPGTSYIVAYRIGDDAIEVLTVMHGAKLWPRSL